MKKFSVFLVSTSLVSTFSVPALSLTKEAFDMRIEAFLNYRDSQDETVNLTFPPGASMQTVDPGKHAEVSKITFQGRVQLSENWQASTKIDFIDKYERNPTSGDQKVDIDSLIVRYGTRHTHGLLPEKTTFYVQGGKFAGFERQEDRHLESYGLISTAFNRLEDIGFEAGVDLPVGFYAKASVTAGTPLFFRDPNALAGDNGVGLTGGDKAKYNGGMPVLYDAEVEIKDLSDNPEAALGLGWRWVNNTGVSRVNVLMFARERDLADTIELTGTDYGADLDFLAVEPSELAPGTISSTVGPALDGKKKKEAGANIWWYYDRFALFGQYVDQDVAGLKRDGWEVELSYAFPGILGLQSIMPVVRYSRLDPSFHVPDLYPGQAIDWEWEKVDYGVNFDVNKYVRLTVEYADNSFVEVNDAGDKKDGGNDEFLATLRLRYDF